MDNMLELVFCTWVASHIAQFAVLDLLDVLDVLVPRWENDHYPQKVKKRACLAAKFPRAQT